ncbi:unnamed protein product [Symbiodinium sp. CCMP2456]|nr:unnamed protein product [Symbiodinium sp. CCMP2456]
MFKASVRSLQKASKQARRDRLEGLIQQAEHAAKQHSPSELYRIINQIAPKKRHDRIRVRSEDGRLLDKKKEFEAIFTYFQKAFSRRDTFDCPPLQPLGIEPSEVQEAIMQLKNNKAVPEGSLPAEMWKLCPELCADWLSRILAQSTQHNSLPAEVLAIVLRTRLLAIVQDRLRAIPQFAYCPQKAIDQAISRVAQHCATVRELVRHNTVATHERREGRQQAECKGGIMLSLDLSRAFDLLSRAALDKSFTAANVPAELRTATIQIHESCRYTVRHGSQQDQFALQVGVRQGCALSPLLYALYTAWLYEQIALETDHQWASRFLTIFADDNSQLYGLHAVGLTAPVLRDLEAADARALRAIATSPAHIFHDTLKKLLVKRCARVSDDWQRNWFERQLQALENSSSTVDVSLQVHLTPQGIPGVPCPECGVVFVNRRHMLSHAARKHKSQEPAGTPQETSKDTRKSGVWYMQHAVMGMPHCRHCDKKFTRFEGFKKHLRQACPILHANCPVVPSQPKQCDTLLQTEHAAELVVQVASAREGSEGPTPQACPDDAEPASSVNVSDALQYCDKFRTLSLSGWRNVLRDQEFCKSLSTYCVLCGQWASPTGFKQHIRLCHQNTHAIHARAVARCTQIGLAAVSPCRYCGAVVKLPSRSQKMASMDVEENDRAAVAQREMAVLGLPGANPTPGAASGQAEGDSWKNWEKENKGWGEQEGRQKWPRSEGGKGPGRSYGGWPKRKTPEQEEKAALDKQTQVLLQLMTRMTLRHEKELCRIRVDTSFVMFCDVGNHGCLPQLKATAENWSEKYVAQQVTTSLRVIMMLTLVRALRDKLDKVTVDDELAGKYKTLSWLTDGANAMSPCWNYLEWSSSEKKENVSQTTQPIKHQDVLSILDRLDHFIPQPGILTAFQNTKGMDSRQASEVVPFLISVGLRQEGTAEVHASLQKLSGCSCMKLVACRLRRPRSTPTVGQEPRRSLHGDGVLRLVQSSHTVEDPGRSSTSGASRSTRQDGDVEAPALPAARLVNPDNLCYANSVLQAFYWGGVVTRRLAESYGAAQAGVHILARSGNPYLPQCMPLQILFRGWRNLRRQNDAAEFYAHVVEVAQASIYAGAWEARLDNPHTVSDGGTLQSPVLLHFPGADLTALIHAWHRQHAIHALRFHSGVLTLQLCRYIGLRKNRQSLPITAGERISLPVFSEPQGTDVRWESFRVIWVIFHLGATVTSGHYQAALCLQAGGNWVYKICNDAKSPKDPNLKETQHIARDGYLVGLLHIPANSE